MLACFECNSVMASIILWSHGMRVLIPSLTSPFGSLFFTSEVLTRMQCPAWCWRRLVLKSLACHRASLGSIPVRWSLIGWQSEGFSVLTTPGFPPYRAHNAFTLQSKLLWFARLAEGQEICCLAGLFSSWQLHAHFHHKLRHACGVQCTKCAIRFSAYLGSCNFCRYRICWEMGKL